MALYAAGFVAAVAVIVGVMGVRRSRDDLLRIADRALVWICFLTALATMGLTLALVDADLSLRYVAQHVALNQPPAYRAAALWTASAGQALLFAFLLTALLTFALRPDAEVMCWPVPLGAAAVFVAILWSVMQMPFARLPWQPTEGIGMQPALQSYDALAVAPLALVSWASLLVAAVLASAASWMRVVRWLLAAWIGFTTTVALGAHLLLRLEAPVWRDVSKLFVMASWIALLIVLTLPRLRRLWWPRERRAGVFLTTAFALGTLLAALSALGYGRAEIHTLTLGQGESLDVRDKFGRAWSLSQQGVSAYRVGNQEVRAVALEAMRQGGRGHLLVAQRAQFLDSRGEQIMQPLTWTSWAHGPVQSLSARIESLLPNEAVRVRLAFTSLAVWLWPGLAMLVAAGALAFASTWRSTPG